MTVTFARRSLLITLCGGAKTIHHVQKFSGKQVKGCDIIEQLQLKGHSVSLKQVKPILHTVLLIPAIIVGNVGSQNMINI